MKEKGTSYSEFYKNFCEKYKKEIVPTVKIYEKSRKTKLINASILSSVFFVLGTFLVFVAFNEKTPGRLIELIFYLYLLSFLSWYWIKKNFEKSIKKKIMPAVCSCFENMNWSCEVYHQGNLFTEAGVVPKFNYSKYDDIFKGLYKDINYEIVEAKYIIGSRKHRTTVFEGVVVKIDLNKTFNSHTVIKPNLVFNISPVKNLNHTQLEDIQFNKKFDVYTNDEIEARVLITPIFMERLKNMKTAFSSADVSCAFYKEYLIIALPTNRDLFSICSLIKPIYDKEQYEQMYEEVLSIIKLIDYFKLNKK